MVEGVSRAQASVEYVLLCAALICVSCLLVRFETPVVAVARAVEGAVAPHQAVHHPHRGVRGHHRSPAPRVCWCAAPRGAE